MPGGEQRPLALVEGNCQAHFLAAVLRHSGLAEACVVGSDLGFIPAWGGKACVFVDEAEAMALVREARDAGRPVVSGEQVALAPPDHARPWNGDVEAVIRFPQLQFFAQSPAEFQRHYGVEQSPEALFEADVDAVRACQRQSGAQTDYAGMMLTVGRREPLFHSALHPGARLNAAMLSDFALRLPGCDPVAIGEVTRQLACGEGINFTSCHPVPRSRQTAFGADWDGDYPFYAEFLGRAERSDWGWVMENADRARRLFPQDTQTWNVLSLAATAHQDGGLAALALERLLALSPGFAEFWRRAFERCVQTGDDAGFSALMARAGEFFGERRQFFGLAAHAWAGRGRWEEAIACARTGVRRTPGRLDAHRVLLEVLLKAGRRNEAQRHAWTLARGRDVPRMGELKACLAGMPEVEWECLTRPDPVLSSDEIHALILNQA